MKNSIVRFIGLITVCLPLAVCTNGPCVSQHCLEFPAIPPAWETLLGQPVWKVEWYNPDGNEETRYAVAGERVFVSLPYTTANVVLAWPFWPGRDIAPGIFMPAGGLFPFDARGDTFSLTWKGGVDAVLYRELARASVKASNGNPSVPRLPANFNWPRFRELYADPTVNAAFRADPWLADWPSIAQRIRQSGFDKRRLVPQARVNLRVQEAEESDAPKIPLGPWVGTSPFAPPLLFDDTPIFSVRVIGNDIVNGHPDTWVCATGILRASPDTWLFMEYE